MYHSLVDRRIQAGEDPYPVAYCKQVKIFYQFPFFVVIHYLNISLLLNFISRFIHGYIFFAKYGGGGNGCWGKNEN